MKIINNKLCSGCHACYNICPKNCISMVENEEGFLYPVIDGKKCINCGLCEKNCPVLNEYKGQAKGKAYACINKNEEVRLKSSSGGVFTLIAEKVIDSDGVVFGAAFAEDFSINHIEVTSRADLAKLRSSKYLQSRIGDTYKKAEGYLQNGKTVLFTGTPCQISGLKAYLKKDYENLILQDIICHGVPSPMVWKKYLEYKNKQKGVLSREPFPAFRRKEKGWKRYSLSLCYNDKEYLETLDINLYMKAFLNNLCLRSSCYDCHSKSLERESDITLADFWGIDSIFPEMDDDKGTSLVLVNSERGSKIFAEIAEQMIYKEVDIDTAVKFNPSAYESVKLPKNRKKFMTMMGKVSFDKVVIKCSQRSIFRRIASKAKRIIIKILRRR